MKEKRILLGFSLSFFIFSRLAFWIENDFLEFTIFSFLIIILLSLGVYSVKHCFSRKDITKWDIFFTTSFLIVGFFSRTYRLSEKSLWLDEDEVIGEILGYFHYGGKGFLEIVKSTALSQQPPLDYFFEAFSLLVLGENEWGARGHAVFFGVAMIIILYLLIKFLTKSYIFACLGGFLAIINPYLIYYSQEGRPNSTASFFTILYLFSISHYLLRPLNKYRLYFVFSIQTLYLFVIGMQPPVIICLIGLLTFLFFYKKSEVKEKLYLLLFLIILSFVIYSPYLLNIYIMSKDYFSLGVAIGEGYRFWDVMKLVLHPYTWWFFPTFFTAISFTIFKYVRSRSLSPYDCFFFTLSTLFFLFILSIVASFYFFIDYLLQERYIIVAFPIFILIAILSLQKTVHGLSSHWRFISLLPLLLLLIPVWQNVSAVPSYYGHINTVIYPRKNWKKIYHYIEKESSFKDVAIFLDLSGHDGGWIQDGLILHNVYMPNHGRKTAYIHSQHSNLDYIQFFKKLTSGFKKDIKNIFIVIDPGFHMENLLSFEKVFSDQHMDKVDFCRDSAALVVKLKIANSVAKTLNNFFKALEKSFENHEGPLHSMVPIYYSLGYLGIKLDNIEQVREYLKKMNTLGAKDRFREHMNHFQSFLNEKDVMSKIKSD
ncbi:MAG: glycosyltransferase family 39 protein [Bacteriovoracales bacterium]|nr:glycosyltransferase family 39 protein [Bacteriovoracales bacterium]